jgi:hypothetical protein
VVGVVPEAELLSLKWRLAAAIAVLLMALAGSLEQASITSAYLAGCLSTPQHLVIVCGSGGVESPP